MATPSTAGPSDTPDRTPRITPSPTPLPRPRSTPIVLAAGACSLAVAIGISRFAYTPILPVMQADLGLDNASMGWLASMNYLGYLLGALLGGLVPGGRRGDTAFRLMLAVVVVATAGMALDTTLGGWSALRLGAGLASGVVFVMAADRVMRIVQPRGQAHLAGAHFSGVGVGIVLSGLLVPVLGAMALSVASDDARQWADWQLQWLGLGAVSIVLAALPWWVLTGSRGAPEVVVAVDRAAAPAALAVSTAPTAALVALLFAYTLDGFGYIISGTFLVAMVERTGGLALGATLWVLVGIAGIVSCLVSTLAARRYGYLRALLVAHALQIVGVAIPVFTATPVLLALGALLFGATFMAITTLALALGRALMPGRSALVIGGLTFGYGIGQVAGPLVAGPLADRSGSFDSSALLACLALGIAATILGLARRGLSAAS